jgi:hypothetical protein
MKALSRVAVIAPFMVALLAQACARQHDGDDRARQPDAASKHGLAAADPGASLHVVADAALPPPSAAGAPSELGVEVWVGTLHNAFVGGVSWQPDDTALLTADVAAVLVLRDDADGKLQSGTIAFGKASEAPTLDALPSDQDAGLDAFWYVARHHLLEGFDYRILSAARSTTQLSFLLSSAQLWQSWCCHGDGSYECPAEVPAYYEGPGALGPSMRCSDLPITQSFDLRIDGELMEGTLAPGDDIAHPVLRLRRQH